jgi:GNAT superfamily N-acetyltransferase
MSLVYDPPTTPVEGSRPNAVVDLTAHLDQPAAQPTSKTPSPEVPPEVPDSRVPQLRTHADAVIAEVDDRKVGESTLRPTGHGWGVRVYVHPAWRRRGLGSRLLHGVVAMAVDRGIGELDVRLDAQDLAGLRLVLASGLCGSISCDGGETRTRLVLARTSARVGDPVPT